MLKNIYEFNSLKHLSKFVNFSAGKIQIACVGAKEITELVFNILAPPYSAPFF